MLTSMITNTKQQTTRQLQKIQNIQTEYQTAVSKLASPVIRTNPKGTELLMAKPCKNCANYLKKNIYINGYKLNKIYFTDNNNICEFK